MAGRKIDPVPLACLLTYALAPSAMLKDTLRDLALDAGPEVREIDLDLITQPLILDALAEGEAKGRDQRKSGSSASPVSTAFRTPFPRAWK